jgi:hypothetical protein
VNYRKKIIIDTKIPKGYFRQTAKATREVDQFFCGKILKSMSQA